MLGAVERTVGEVLSLCVLVTIALAGCIAPNASTVSVPIPSVGASYTYEGNDGSRLRVTVESYRSAIDGFLRTHQALQFNWTLRTPHETEPVFRFIETVDPQSGLIVNQAAKCTPEGTKTDRSCRDERGMVLYAAGGVPGAFGVGPLWRSNLSAGAQARIGTHPIPVDDPSFVFDTAPADLDRRPCLELTRADREIGNWSLHVLPWTVISGPVVICEGLAFPASFATVDGREYSLVNRSLTDSPVDEPIAESKWGTPNREVDRRLWTSPLVVGDPTDPSNFSVPEAHEAAMEQDASYRRLFSGDSDGLVVGTTYHVAGETSTIEGVNETVERRQLVAVDSKGSTETVTMEKRTNAVGMSEIQQVDEDQASYPDPWRPPPTSGRIADRQVEVRDAIGHARALIGEPRMSALGPDFVPRKFPHPWSDASPRLRNDGFTLLLWFEDPSGVEGSQDGYTFPYAAVVDGPSGAFLAVTANSSRLPVEA